MFQGTNISPTDSFPQRGGHAADHNHRMTHEDDVVFRMLCHVSKIGGLIGKGGSVIRAIQSETGASVKIGDPVAPDSDERVVIVSAREARKQ